MRRSPTYREAIRLKPDDADTHYNLGIALKAQGKLTEAVAEYRTAIRLEPNHANAHCNLGLALADQGKLAEAIAEYREAIRLKPDHPEALNSLAWALVVSPKRPRQDYDEGLVHARKAVELAPKDGNTSNTLALAEYRAGHWNESIAASERSMALRNGGNANDWLFLAMAHWRKGEKDEARRWFDKAVAWTKEKDPKNAELRQFWTEAAELLGQPGPDAAGGGPARGPRGGETALSDDRARALPIPATTQTASGTSVSGMRSAPVSVFAETGSRDTTPISDLALR